MYTAACIIQILFRRKFESIYRIYWISLDFLFKIKVLIFSDELNSPQISTGKSGFEYMYATHAGAGAAAVLSSFISYGRVHQLRTLTCMCSITLIVN